MEKYSLLTRILHSMKKMERSGKGAGKMNFLKNNFFSYQQRTSHYLQDVVIIVIITIMNYE